MSEKPKRIQLSRRRGYRKPEGAVVVARPSRWGNPVRWQDCPENLGPPAWARGVAADWYREWIMQPEQAEFRSEVREHLSGHDLACWCPLADEHGNRVPCHADVLPDIANSPEESLREMQLYLLGAR